MPVARGEAQGTSSEVTSPTHTNHAQRRLQLTSSEALRAAIVNALTGVTLDGVLISWASETQAEVTLLKATIATESSSTLASAISNGEFVRSLSNELSKSVSLTAVPKISTVLVHPPSPPPPRPAEPGGSVLPPLNNVTGPTLTVTRTAINQAMAFRGTNMQDGDHAAWVPASTSACSAAAVAAAELSGRSATVAAGKVAFTTPSTVGVWILCYRHSQQLTSDATNSHLLYPSIQLVVVRVDSGFPALAPAVSACDGHVITMVGAGFSRLPASSYCNFETVGVVAATVVSDTKLHCTTPVPSSALVSKVRLVFDPLYGDTSTHPTVIPLFTFYSQPHFYINRTSPFGGAVNLETTVSLIGGFPFTGALTCHFGGNVSAVATLLNATHAKCVKPAVPNASAGTRVQPLRVSATGKCFSNGAAEFTTYTAQVVSLSVTGAPYSTPIRLHIYGTGFPFASGSSCWFTNGSSTLRTSAVVDSSTQVTCWSPSVAYPGRYRVYLSLNGLQVEPSLYTTPTFDAYDLAAVRVSQLVPSAVPLETSTALTIKAIAAPGELSVSISLNGGADGTFAADQRTLLVYSPPKITSITPSGGDAQGGEVVTISGSGFSATSASNVLCSFGGTLQLTQPTTVTDTQVVCSSTWGDESELGSSVGVSLNDGVSLHESSAVRFKYSGVYRPQLVDAFFSQDATKLLMQFASAETNKQVSVSEPECIWVTTTTVVAFLTVGTAAAPGMRVAFLPGTIWPKSWNYPGSCSVPNAKCNTVSSTELSGSGANRLSFTWGAHPILSENYYQVQSVLTAATERNSATVSLGPSELNYGASFVIWLQVKNFLGIESAIVSHTVNRSALPIPAIYNSGAATRLSFSLCCCSE
ncbi:hypothetical protein AB1Y20_004253 [Prymnesium parvum]|uniref:IPT/TIG domain-containing protein n=1 Tax=Prymnesium parvum TaxID=97485 RepID=A0AB34J9X3_PRYPA